MRLYKSFNVFMQYGKEGGKTDGNEETNGNSKGKGNG